MRLGRSGRLEQERPQAQWSRGRPTLRLDVCRLLPEFVHRSIRNRGLDVPGCAHQEEQVRMGVLPGRDRLCVRLCADLSGDRGLARGLASDLSLLILLQSLWKA